MHTTEHTDPDGDALTVHRDKGLAWVTITRDSDELTVGPVPAHALTGQHRGSHTRDEKRNAESCPLTPDAITELVKTSETRLADAIRALYPDVAMSTYRIASAVFDALAPPARPEGAEEIDEPLRQANAAALGGALTPEQRRALADHLAAMHVRVVGLVPDPDPSRCPMRATDPITTRHPREDGWRCGYEAGHGGGHELFTSDGEDVLYAGRWVHPNEVGLTEKNGAPR